MTRTRRWLPWILVAAGIAAAVAIAGGGGNDTGRAYDPTSTSPIGTKALVALAAIGVALTVAGPALAEPSKTPPTEKKGCTVQLQGPGAGQSIVYPDGYKFSVYAQNDRKTHTYTCNDGKWTETVSLTAGPARWGNVAILGTAGGTLQAVQLRY